MAEISSLGKYEIRRQIGRGAMGVVYEGYDPLIKRIVALKTIRSDQLADDDSATVVARFRREAQAAGRLNHPNIVSIYDFGEDAGVWYIAMEFIQGRELKECFETNERFKITDIGRIMSQILGALDYSHRQGVIHRDIKPANIFLLPDGSVKVADFGIAHIEASNLTQAGTVMGTPSYMSPEQIQGLPVDGRSDLFSAGVILYQFLTGERPFAGSSTTTMQKVLKEDPHAAVDAERAGDAGDGRGRAQGARQASRRALPDGRRSLPMRSRRLSPPRMRSSTMNRSADATMMAPLDRTMLNRRRGDWAPARRCRRPTPPPPHPLRRRATLRSIVVGVAALVAIVAAGWFWLPASGRARDDRRPGAAGGRDGAPPPHRPRRQRPPPQRPAPVPGNA